MAYVTLNGSRLTLTSNPVVLGANGPQGDGTGFRSHGKRREYWQQRSEEWIAENIAAVEKAPPARKRAVITATLDDAQALEFAPLPGPVIAALIAAMEAPAPDYTDIAAALLIELRAAARARQGRRDLEALMVLGW